MAIKKILTHLRLFLVFVLSFLLAGRALADPAVAASCDNQGMCTGSFLSGGLTRTFHYFMHNSGTKNPTPVYHIFYIFHAENSNGADFDANILGGSMDHGKAQVPYLMVYPDAINGHWNFGPDSSVTNVDDVGFIRELMEFFEHTHSSSLLKNYAAGMSNGGLMVFRIACDLSEKLNAIAVVDAAMPVSIAKTCKPKNPLSLLLIEGRNDPYLPWSKNYMIELGMPVIATLSPIETFNFWAWINKVNVPSVFWLIPLRIYDGTYVYKQSKKTNSLEMRMYTIFGGGHTWPGAEQYLPENMYGKTSHNVYASPSIIDFFWGH
jgi:polyhydroxybutyrate depolymerase